MRNKMCSHCNVQMIHVVSFQNNSIHEFFKCERCKEETEHVVVERNENGIQEFYKRELIT